MKNTPFRFTVHGHAPRRIFAVFLLLVAAVLKSTAQAPNAGAVIGRVQDATTGRYLANARVTVVGANRDVFTNESGEYQIGALPAGNVELRVYYTGEQPQTATVTVAPGQTAQRDFVLSGVFVKPETTPAGETVKLDEFVVATKRVDDAAEIAINEQRFSPNIKSVVTTAAFGDIGQDNVGEFLKFLPGVEAVYGDMNINNVQLRGMPTAQTPVSIDGASIVSSSTLSTDRNTNFQAISLNNVSRIEVSKVALPDSRADSLGGSVNLVSRNAFERSRPELSMKFFAQMNSHFPELHKTPGGNDGGDGREYKWFPNWEINYVNPITKNFGIAINSARNDKWVLTRRLTKTYSISNTDAAHPYLSGYTLLNYPAFETRNTGGIRFDWRFAPRDVLSFNSFYSRYFSNFEQHQLAYSAGTLNAALADGTRDATTGDFSPTFTQGRAGQGSVNDWLGTNYAVLPNIGGSLSYRHTGTIWEWDAIFSGNESKVAYRNTSLGQFGQARANKSELTVRFDDINQWGPGKITVLRDNAVIDPLSLGDAVFAQGPNQTRDAKANARNFNLNFKRKSAFESFYGSLKAGYAFRSDARDRAFGQYTPTYVGPGGNATINALPPGTLEDPVFSYYAMARGYAAPQWISARKANTLFLAHPEYFIYPIATQVIDRNAMAAAAEELQEQVHAGYLMADATIWKNRLRLVGGMRYERTIDDGRGLLNDPSRQYQKDTSGKILLDSARKPIPITTDPLEVAKLTQIPLGNHVHRSYGDWYPSISATFNATDNALVRFGYARTLGRPNYGNLLPTLSVAQVTNPAEDATGSGLGTINAKNPNLKPWTADNFDVSAEYYTKSGGFLSAGVFRKNIKDFFSNTTSIATAEFLDQFQLSHDYLNYQVNFPGNVNGVVHITGVELAAQQKLQSAALQRFGTFSVFANVSVNRNIGPRESDFRGYVRKRVNAGFTFARQPVTFTTNFYYTGKYYNTTSAIAPDGLSYIAARPRFDATLEYRLTQRFALFLWGRNIFNDRDKTLVYGRLTPDYAKYNVESDYGVIFQAGVKASF